MQKKTRTRGAAWRSRWAAVGAAVAVTLGAGGMVAVNAASSDPSSFVSIDPTRILDTRTDVGLAGPFVSGVAQKLQVTGIVPTQPPGGAAPVNVEVVPSTATSAVFNVTVVRPSTKGFLSIRPGDASGTPATSNINWAAGGPNIANAVTVQLPVSGQIDIFVNGTVGEVLIDVAGYYIPAAAGPPGPKGDQGDPGPAGVIGDITMTNAPGPTDPYLGNPATLVVGDGYVRYSTPSLVTMSLSAPVTVGGETRRLQSLEYCLSAVAAGNTVDIVSLTSAPFNGGPGTFIIDDTDRTATGCYTVDASTLVGGDAYSFNVALAGAGGTIDMSSVQTTWTTAPATPLSVSAQSAPRGSSLLD